MKIRKTRRADGDLRRIYEFYAKENPSVAIRIVREINVTFQLLAEYPMVGRDRSSFRAAVRSIVSGQHIVFYTVVRDAILIVRVIDGRMDLETEFKN